MQKYTLAIISSISIALIIIATLMIIMLAPPEKKKIGFDKNLMNNQIGGDFSLINAENNQLISSKIFRGKLMLVYFGFTFCPDICPMELGKITMVLEKLKKHQHKIQTLFITIDPDRDTAENLKQYIKSFDSNILALTGDSKQISEVASLYKVYYAKDNPNSKQYLLNHSSFIYLMGMDGKFITYFSQQTSPDEMVKTILNYL